MTLRFLKLTTLKLVQIKLSLRTLAKCCGKKFRIIAAIKTRIFRSNFPLFIQDRTVFSRVYLGREEISLMLFIVLCSSFFPQNAHKLQHPPASSIGRVFTTKASQSSFIINTWSEFQQGTHTFCFPNTSFNLFNKWNANSTKGTKNLSTFASLQIRIMKKKID